jgi:hypothetical protein
VPTQGGFFHQCSRINPEGYSSWELGTAVEALMDFSWPSLPVFAPTAFPPPAPLHASLRIAIKCVPRNHQRAKDVPPNTIISGLFPRSPGIPFRLFLGKGVPQSVSILYAHEVPLTKSSIPRHRSWCFAGQLDAHRLVRNYAFTSCPRAVESPAFFHPEIA